MASYGDSANAEASSQTDTGDVAAAVAATAAPAAPLREDILREAVNFLIAPSVRPAAKERKVTFLVNKGLTPTEIDEAFQRADVAAPAALPATAVATVPTQQVYTQQPAQPNAQGMVTVPAQLVAPPPPPPRPQGMRWTQAALGLTVVAAGAYGLQRLLAPYIKEYYDRWVASVAERGNTKALAAKEQTEANLLADAIKKQTEAQQEALKALQETTAQLKETAAELRAASSKKDSELPIDRAALRAELRADARADLRAELRSFAETIAELSAVPPADETPESSRYTTPNLTPSKASYGYGDYSGNNGFAVNGAYGSSDRPAFAAPAFAAPTPPPPSGTKSGSSSLAGDPPKPGSYAEVMAMLAAGQTPPNVRHDIRDTPPDPMAPPSTSRLAPKPKPWERKAPGSSDSATAPWTAPQPPPLQPSQQRQPLSDIPRPASAAGSARSEEAGSSSAAAAADSNADSAPAQQQQWRPPPVPQPSMPLPRRRSNQPPGSPARSTTSETAAKGPVAAEAPAAEEPPAGGQQRSSSSQAAPSYAAVAAVPTAEDGNRFAALADGAAAAEQQPQRQQQPSTSEITPADDEEAEAGSQQDLEELGI